MLFINRRCSRKTAAPPEFLVQRLNKCPVPYRIEVVGKKGKRGCNHGNPKSPCSPSVRLRNLLLDLALPFGGPGRRGRDNLVEPGNGPDRLPALLLSED